MNTPHVDKKNEEVNYTTNEVVYSNHWETYRDKDYFEYRRIWSQYPKEKFVSEFPIHLDIETTELCNLKCPMCPRTSLVQNNSEIKNKQISKDEYKQIIDQAVENGVKSIKLQYLGEPLLHPDIVWQVQYAKEKGIIDVMFGTNGTQLTKEVSRALLEAGLDKLTISFDAASPKLYEQQRVGTTIGKVIDNVYNFVKLRDEISPKTCIRIAMVMYDDPIWKAQYEAIKIMWKDIVDAVGYGIFVERDEHQQEAYEKVEGFCCEQLFQRMFLKSNGNVCVCCVDDKDEYVVGNWKEESLKDIWHNQKYKQIRDAHINNQYDKIDICTKCYVPEIYKRTFKS